MIDAMVFLMYQDFLLYYLEDEMNKMYSELYFSDTYPEFKISDPLHD